ASVGKPRALLLCLRREHWRIGPSRQRCVFESHQGFGSIVNPRKIEAFFNAGLKKYGPFCGLLAFCLIAVAVVYHKELRVFYVPPAKSSTNISDDYNDAGGKLTNVREIEGKPIRTEYGMAVAPGQEWRVTYDFEKDADEDVWMQLSFYRPTAA